MLTKSKLVGLVATAKPAEAKRFYQGVLGLSLVEDDPFARVFNACGPTLRVQKVHAVSPAPHTVLGWQVGDIHASARGLSPRGVAFERYDGLLQDALGIWRTPDGSRVAWFKDPDGNTLSLTQHGEGSWPAFA